MTVPAGLPAQSRSNVLFSAAREWPMNVWPWPADSPIVLPYIATLSSVKPVPELACKKPLLALFVDALSITDTILIAIALLLSMTPEPLLLVVTLLSTAVSPAELTCMSVLTPATAVFDEIESWIKTLEDGACRRIPKLEKWRTEEFTISSDPPVLKTIPLTPTPAPFSVSPRSTTASLGPALMSMASAPGLGTIPASTPSGLVMVTALVMLIGPNPALSMAVTSPPASTALTAA